VLVQPGIRTGHGAAGPRRGLLLRRLSGEAHCAQPAGKIENPALIPSDAVGDTMVAVIFLPPSGYCRMSPDAAAF